MLILSERWVLMPRRELEELLRDLRKSTEFISTRMDGFDERVERLWSEAVSGEEVNEG
jgi:hypothetical protein